jgi:hypothetical protein
MCEVEHIKMSFLSRPSRQKLLDKLLTPGVVKLWFRSERMAAERSTPGDAVLLEDQVVKRFSAISPRTRASELGVAHRRMVPIHKGIYGGYRRKRGIKEYGVHSLISGCVRRNLCCSKSEQSDEEFRTQSRALSGEFLLPVYPCKMASILFVPFGSDPHLPRKSVGHKCRAPQRL